MPRTSELLQAKIRIASVPLDRVVELVWGHGALAQLLPEFLASLYDSVRATIPLLEAARRASVERSTIDRVAAMLLPYPDTHIADEFEHDEWLLKDLSDIGFSRDVMANRLPRPSIAAMAGAQYYWIFHSHPVAILGYLAVLEGNPPTTHHLDWLQTRTGLPDAAFRMLRHHAMADEQHAAELFAFIDTLPLSEHQQTLLGISALHTLGTVHDFFRDLAASFAPPRDPVEPRP